MPEPQENTPIETPPQTSINPSSSGPEEEKFLILEDILRDLPAEDRLPYWEAFNKLFTGKTTKLPFFVVLLDEEFTFEFFRSGTRAGNKKTDNFAILDSEPFQQWHQVLLDEIAYNKKTPKQRAAVSRDQLKSINKDKVTQEFMTYLKTLQPATK